MRGTPLKPTYPPRPAVPMPRTDVTESEEQKAIFEWAALTRNNYPELSLLHAIPNGGKRGKAEAARFKAEGVKPGVPDMFLPVPRGNYHGLYIELKRRDGGRLSQEQKEWLMALNRQGYRADVCNGAAEAIEVIKEYLEDKR